MTGSADLIARPVSTRQLSKNTSALVAQVEAGETTLTVTRHGVPVAIVMPLDLAGQIGLEATAGEKDDR
jgi:prevent-host-death family protein